MRYRDTFLEAAHALAANKIRSSLTILGIVIGIASVVTLVALGQGATGQVRQNIAALGSNLLVITPNTALDAISLQARSAHILTTDDVAALRAQVPAVAAAVPTISNAYPIAFEGRSTRPVTIGTEPDYAQVRNLRFEYGTFFTAEQNTRAARVVVLGPSVAKTLFGEGADPIGRTVRLNKLDFMVVGVTAPKGGTEASGADTSVYIPFNTIRQYFMGGNEPVQAINVSAGSEDAIDDATREATGLLLDRHGIRDPAKADFVITNQTDIAESLTETTRTLTLLLGAIAGISLLVGGIGIMNMMLTAVTERTREIGLRKALGATQKDIRRQFLTESVVLTIIGGGIGMVAGCGCALLANSTGIAPAAISVWSIMTALGTTSLVGIGFGYYPARKAALLSPIQALKYE